MKFPPGILLTAMLFGCAASPPPEQEKVLPPPPSNFDIGGTIDLNLTPQMALETGLPPTLKVTLHAEAHSTVLTISPMSSHHDGRMTLVVTDTTGKQTLLNIDFGVHGDSEGTPTQGLGDAVSRFIDTAMLMSRPLEHLPTTSH